MDNVLQILLEALNGMTIEKTWVLFFVFLLGDYASGIVRAIRAGKTIKSAITKEKMFKKFDYYKYFLGGALLAHYVNQPEAAKMVLLVPILIEAQSIIENAFKAAKKREQNLPKV